MNIYENRIRYEKYFVLLNLSALKSTKSAISYCLPKKIKTLGFLRENLQKFKLIKR